MHNTRKSTPLYKKIITLIISLLLICIQGGIFYLIFYSSYQNTWVYFFVEMLAMIAVLDIYASSLNPNYKLIWSLIILSFPVVGIVFYLFIQASHTLPRRKSKKIYRYIFNKIPTNNDLDLLKQFDIVGYGLAKSINYSTDYPIYRGSNVRFYADVGLKNKHMFDAMSNAKKYIFIEFFILADGKLLSTMVDILSRKGSEGIEIKIIYDDIGSKTRISRQTLKRIKEIPNLTITAYEPLGININPTINYRDHRKMAIIDGKIVFSGGDNLADEYAHIIEKYGHWRDNCISISGPAVDSYLLLFAEMWYMSTKITLDVNSYEYANELLDKDCYVMPFGDGPTNDSNPAYDLFENLISSATQYLYISTPYFIIDDSMIHQIESACKRGVDVTILVPHIPDKKSVFMITQVHYKRILLAGGHIYEYTKGFNHAKNIIVDDKYAFIGTINMDYRSLFLHYECGSLLVNDEAILDMKYDFLVSLNSSKNITLHDWKKRNIFARIIGNILAFFSPLL